MVPGSTRSAPASRLGTYRRGTGSDRFGFWWAQLRGGASDTERRAKETELAAYLAEDLDPALDDEVDDAEVLVEVKTAPFLTTLDLPLSDELAR